MGYRGYWGYYEPTTPIPVKNGIKAKSKRGDIGETWWSKRWIEVLKSFNMGARLTRGRSYARRGQVISIDIEPGIVRAKVQGSRPRPYSVKIQLRPFSDKVWERVIDAMASKAIFAAKLLAGEMPKNIEEAFEEAGVSLFPKTKRDLITDCSCPDWANPCKHIAAVYYLLAEQFDEDPFLIFRFRGRNREQIISALRKKRTSAAKAQSAGAAGTVHREEMPLEECIDSFWKVGEGLNDFSVDFSGTGVEGAVLKILGNSPFSIGRKNVSDYLEKAYEAAARDALKRALEGI